MAAFFTAAAIRDLEKFDPNTLGETWQTSFLYDAQDQLITGIHGRENRIRISLNQIPVHVRDAFIASEDIRFAQHRGFDVRRMFGALIENIRARALVQGAGTITQQLIRNTILTQEKTFRRKIQEIYLAYKIEQRYTKDQILEMYLNVIYFARGAYGIEAAAKTYFGKPTKDLTIAEGALLAGIIKHPHRFSPFINEDLSLQRKDLVLDLMMRYGKLNLEEGTRAKEQDLTFSEDTNLTLPHGYFIDRVLAEAAERLNIGDELLYTAGYRIYTTLDTELQQAAEALFANDDLFPKSPVSGTVSEGALVVLDTATGEIRALMGGRIYPEGQRRVLNRAFVRRLPGSAIKPLVVFGPALETRAYQTVTFMEDEPVTIGGYSPKNFGGTIHGTVTLREAVARSINIPAVKLLHEIGILRGISFAENLGIPFTPGDRLSLTIALGGMEQGVTPLEMARAYAAFGDRGSYKETTVIRRIEDARGAVLYEYRPVKRQAISEATAYIMSHLLKSAAQPGGTASRLAALPFPLSAKTGTQQLPDEPRYAGADGYHDAWIAAYNPEYTFVVWMGFDAPTAEYLPPDATGGRYPAEIVRQLAARAYEAKTPPAFRMPLEVVEADLDKRALEEENRVLLATPLTPKAHIQTEVFTQDAVPQDTSDYWRAPHAPLGFLLDIGPDDRPALSFVPQDAFAAYVVYRIASRNAVAEPLERIQTGRLDRVLWLDTEAQAGRRYGYYVMPIHPEILRGGAPLTGPASPTLYIDVPRVRLPGRPLPPGPGDAPNDEWEDPNRIDLEVIR